MFAVALDGKDTGISLGEAVVDNMGGIMPAGINATGENPEFRNILAVRVFPNENRIELRSGVDESPSIPVL